MGCNNSNTLPEPLDNIRNTISKTVPEKELKTQKKIAKNLSTFEELVEELKLMLKENAYYDYLFRAEYFEEMLEYISSTYVNHQEAMRIISLVLEYMALTKNFISGSHNLKTTFHIDTLPSQLSSRWGNIKKQVHLLNRRCLRTINYLAHDIDEQKCWFSHSFLDLKFDFSMEEAIRVAETVKEICRYEERGFSYFSNYLYKCCINEYQISQGMTKVETKLKTVLDQILTIFPSPPPLNGQASLFENQQNFKANIQKIEHILLDLSTVKPTQRVKSIESFLFSKAKQSIKCLTKFNSLFQQICQSYGCSDYHSEVRLKTRSQKHQILKIKEDFIQFTSQLHSIQSYQKKIQKPSFESITNLEYQQHLKQVNTSCENRDGILKFKVFDMLRSQCMFNDLGKLNECCSQLLKAATKNKYKLVEMKNQLRGGSDVPHLLLRLQVEQIICQFKMIFQYNLAGYRFSHLLQQMSKPKYLSAITHLKVFNEEITNNFVLGANEIIEANLKNKENYQEKLNFVEVKPLLKQFISILPFKVNIAKKHHQSIDFNLIYDQIEMYKLVEQQFINNQLKVEKMEKIRRIAEYLFEEKNYNLSSLLFPVYQKEVEENNSYLFDKTKTKAKDFIASEIQLIKSYSESMHFMSEINKENQVYEKAIEYQCKFMELNRLILDNKDDTIAHLKRLAQIYKLDKKYDQALKLYQQCIELEGKELSISLADIHHCIALVYLKMKKFEQALHQEMTRLHILENKVGKESLQYSLCLKDIAEILKMNGDFEEAATKMEKCREMAQKIKSRYSKEYMQVLTELGLYEHRSGNQSKAIIYYQQLIEIVERLAGDHFVQAQNIYLKLGNLYERLDNHAEAIQQYKQSLQLAKRTSGPKSLEVSVILNNLALSHQKLAQYEESLAYFYSSLDIKKAVLGEKNLEYNKTIINIGVVYDQQGKSTEALQKYQQALYFVERQFGKQNSDYAKILNNIGLVEHDRGNYREALKYFEETLSIKEKIQGKQSLGFATTLSNIGMVYDDMCQYFDALKAYQNSLGIFEKIKDSNSQLAAAFINLGTTYMHLSNYKESLKCYEKCLSLEEHLNGVESRQYSLCLHSIGIIKSSTYQYGQAEKFFEKSKRILKKNIGANNYEYSQVLGSLGKLYLNKGFADQALVYLGESLQIIEKVKGKDHVSSIALLLNQGIAYFRLQKYYESNTLLRKGLKLCEESSFKYREYADINYNLGLILIKEEKLIKARQFLQRALLLQQKYFDNSWIISSIKLAACSLMTQNHQKYLIYSAYSNEHDGQIHQQRQHQRRNGSV